MKKASKTYVDTMTSNLYTPLSKRIQSLEDHVSDLMATVAGLMNYIEMTHKTQVTYYRDLHKRDSAYSRRTP